MKMLVSGRQNQNKNEQNTFQRKNEKEMICKLHVFLELRRKKYAVWKKMRVAGDEKSWKDCPRQSAMIQKQTYIQDQ